jgi:hypothetical protein
MIETINVDALNENLEYCNELAKRLNLLADTILALNERVLILEAQAKLN